MGIRILCTFTGNASVDEIAQAHRQKLNLTHCQRSTPYICKLMEDKYGMAANTICPIGVANTDRFLDAVCDMTCAEIPYSLFGIKPLDRTTTTLKIVIISMCF